MNILSFKQNIVIPKLIPITPMELYLLQVKGTFDKVRKELNGLNYIPPHMGGIFGQRDVLSRDLVLEIIDFEIM